MESGIYLITSPTGKNYVGSTNNLTRREKEYRLLNCKNQTLIYNSLKKYGWDAHTFMILEKCSLDLLNEREIFYTKKYKAFVDDGGLVLQVGGNQGFQSQHTRDKKSKSMKGKLLGTLNPGVKESWKQGRTSGNKGNKYTQESKDKLSENKKNHPMYNDEWRDSISKSLKGRKVIWGDKISKTNKGKSRNKGNNLKPILQYTKDNTLIREWDSITQVSEELKLNFNGISNNLLGYCKSSYGYIWKYK